MSNIQFHQKLLAHQLFCAETKFSTVTILLAGSVVILFAKKVLGEQNVVIDDSTGKNTVKNSPPRFEQSMPIQRA